MRPEALTIHGFSTLAGAVGVGMSPLPGADSLALTALQTQMILVLADRCGVSLTQAAAADLALTLAARMVGLHVSRMVLRWVPGLGVAANGAIAAAVTEAIGWAAVAWFEDRPGRSRV